LSRFLDLAERLVSHLRVFAVLEENPHVLTVLLERLVEGGGGNLLEEVALEAAVDLRPLIEDREVAGERVPPSPFSCSAESTSLNSAG